MKIGRNDPCSCGSGKKYKRCCIAKEQAAAAVDHEWQRLRTAEGRVIHLLMSIAHEWYGPAFIEKAWDVYTESSPEPLPFEETPESETSFVPWALFDYVPEEEVDGELLNEAPLPFALRVTTDELDRYELQFVFEACRQPVTFWSVQQIDSGRSVTLRDIFTGTEQLVRERQASKGLSKGDIVYTRVIALGQIAIMCGMAPVPFPPDFHFDILNAREVLFGQRRKITGKDLQEARHFLRRLYFALRQRLLNPRAPILQNTDGDPLEFVKLTYQLNCSVREAFDRLRSLNPFESEEELLADASYDATRHLQRLTFSWSKKGNVKHRSWDNTVMGNVVIENSSLIVDVNSQKRSKLIQREIAKRLGDCALLQDKVSESVEETLAELESREGSEELKRKRDEQAALQALPEVQALMREAAEKHWQKWLSEPIPLLKGKTPRQASKTLVGRERLEALLVDFERRAAEIDDSPFAPNVTELRKKLRMPAAHEDH